MGQFRERCDLQIKPEKQEIGGTLGDFLLYTQLVLLRDKDELENSLRTNASVLLFIAFKNK